MCPLGSHQTMVFSNGHFVSGIYHVVYCLKRWHRAFPLEILSWSDTVRFWRSWFKRPGFMILASDDVRFRWYWSLVPSSFASGTMRFLVFQSCQDLLDSNSSAFRFPVFKEISVFMLLEGYVSIRNSTVNWTTVITGLPTDLFCLTGNQSMLRHVMWNLLKKRIVKRCVLSLACCAALL